MSKNGVAIVVGVGRGLGLALVEAFAGAGLDVAMSARNADELEAMRPDIAGVKVKAYPTDTSDPVGVERLFDDVERELGGINVAIFNAGAFQMGGVLDITPDDFERCWRVGAYGGFLVGQQAAKRMVPRGEGSVLFTGATAALRGSANFVNLAAPKFALRALSQSMARELGPKGIHVAHVIVDGLIESEASRQSSDERELNSRLKPADIADGYLYLHQQPRSAWTQEMDMRPWVEKF